MPPSCPPLPEQLPSGSGLVETLGSKEAAQATRTTARAFASEVSSSSDLGPVFGSAAHQLFGFWVLKLVNRLENLTLILVLEKEDEKGCRGGR